MSEEKLEYIYEKYVEWKARPIVPVTEDPSYPQNASDFIALHGIDKFILDDFTKRPGHYEAVVRESFTWAKSKIPDIIHAVFLDAKKMKTPLASVKKQNANTKFISKNATKRPMAGPTKALSPENAKF